MPVLWLLFSVFLGQLNLIYASCSMPCKGCQWQKSSVTKSLRAVSDRNHLLLPSVSQGCQWQKSSATNSLSRLSGTLVCCYQQSLKGLNDRLVICYQQSLRAVSNRNGLLLPTISQGCQWQKWSAVTNSLSRLSVTDLSSVTNSLSRLSVTDSSAVTKSLRAVSDRNGLLLPSLSRLSVTEMVCCYQVPQGCQWQKWSAVTKSLKAASDRNGLLLPSPSGLSVTEMVCCYQVPQGCQWQKWSAVTKSLEAGTEVPTNQPGLGLVCDGVTHLLYVQDFRATVKGRQSWKAAAIVTLFCGMVQTQPC